MPITMDGNGISHNETQRRHHQHFEEVFGIVGTIVLALLVHMDGVLIAVSITYALRLIVTSVVVHTSHVPVPTVVSYVVLTVFVCHRGNNNNITTASATGMAEEKCKDKHANDHQSSRRTIFVRIR